jgi:hypothetical protein
MEVFYGGIEIELSKTAETEDPPLFPCCGEIQCNCEYPDDTNWDKYEQFYQENQKQYQSEEEYQGNWSDYGHQSESADLAPGEVILEEIQEDLTSVIYGKYTQEEFDKNFRAYTPTLEEFANLYLNNLKIKNVVANQPINRGGSRCTDACDIENHHTHRYCKACKRNLS